MNVPAEPGASMLSLMEAPVNKEPETALASPRPARIGVRGSLFRKYVVYFVVLVSAALIASGAVQLYFTYQENKAALLNLQREKAAAAASRIETYVQEIERQLGWMRLPQVGPQTPEQRRIEYLKLLRLVPAITDVMLLDATGREQLRVSRLGMDVTGGDTDLSNDPKFLETKGGKTYFSPVYFRKETEPYMTIAVAGMGDRAGITVAEVNLKFIWDVISRIKIGKEGLAYVVDSRGHLIAHPDISYVLQKQDLSHLPQVKAARESTGGDVESVTIARSPQGKEVLSAHANIAPLGWHVLVEQPLAEAFAPLYASLQRTGLLLVAGLVLAVLASLYVARRMVKPIEAIQGGAAQLAAGKLEQRIEVNTGDELQALAGQFNDMAAQLKESYAGLERKVDERTHDLTESLQQQTATSEILRIISSTPTDVTPVLHAVTTKAAQLCDASDARLYLIEGDGLRYTAGFGEFGDTTRVLPVTRTRVTGRAVLDQEVIHIEDLAAELDEFPDSRSRQEQTDTHTVLAVPLLRNNRSFGLIMMRRTEVRPFSVNQIELVKTFADQATIAIENVRLFNEIHEKSHQLEVANRHKSEFLASMSHELRTPLNAIIGFSEVLAEKMFGDVNEKQAEYLEDIHSSGTHLLSLINDILDLSKIEAGKMELELSRFDIGAALQNSMTLIRERATRNSVGLSLECNGDLGAWVADERKFKQIMLNLLSNAVKFTPQGGKVTVRAAHVDSRVEIAVADTGIGIKPEDQQLVFEEFRQASGDHLKKSEGTGLGLALTKRFVELHGGTLSLESEVGKGSTFTFTLPERELEAA
jgi:signal transduction histidine kinase/HAMP domain-containing protein